MHIRLRTIVFLLLGLIAFGTAGYKGRLDHVMKDLIAIRDRVRKR